jgi:hypothetical protein
MRYSGICQFILIYVVYMFGPRHLCNILLKPIRAGYQRWSLNLHYVSGPSRKNVKTNVQYIPKAVLNFKCYMTEQAWHISYGYSTSATQGNYHILFIHSFTVQFPIRTISVTGHAGPQGWDIEAATFSRQSAHRWRWDCQPYMPASQISGCRWLQLVA